MAETARMKALKNLAGSFPAANNQLAGQLQAGRQMNVQAAVGGAAPGQPIRQAAQQTGAVVAQTAAEDTKKVVGQGIEGGVQAAGMALEERQAVSGAEQARAQLANRDREMNARAVLSNLSRTAENQIVDMNIQFRLDDANRVALNETQLADWAILKAKDGESFKNYAMKSKQMHDRKIQLMEVANKRLTQALEFESKRKEQRLDYETRKKIAKMKADLEEKIRREKAEAANKQAMWSAAGTVVGVGVGALTGNPAGMAAGASIGGAVGSAVGSRV